MRTRRTVLAGVATIITLAGCSQQAGQPTEEQDTDEFSLEDFRVDGNPPSEYQAEFIAGASPEDAASEFNPLFEYAITGTNNDVETELHITHTDETIPKEELNETRQGQTHTGAGQYQQNIPLPDPVIQMFAETPRNLQATLKATDTQTQQTETQTFEMNYGDSYAEQGIEAGFEEDIMRLSNADLNSVNVEDNTIKIDYKSDEDKGTRNFDLEVAGVAGLYAGVIEDVREPYSLELKVEDVNGDIYDTEVSKEHSLDYLEGDTSFGDFQNKISLEKLAVTSQSTN